MLVIFTIFLPSLPFSPFPKESAFTQTPFFSGHSEEDAVLTALCLFFLANSVEALPKKVIYGQKETLTLKPN